MLKTFLIIALIAVKGIITAKILGVFPTPSISHQVVFRPLMLELAKRGHEITVITTDPANPKDNLQNFTEIDIHDVSYNEWKKIIIEEGTVQRNRIQIYEFVLFLMARTFKVQMQSPEIQGLLHANRKFDLLIYESCVRPALIFSHIYNIPAIEFSSLSSLLSNFDMIGAASHPLLYPGPMQRRIYNLSMWEKLTELYNHFLTQHIYYKHEHLENEMLKKILPRENVPSLSDLAKNVQVTFYNVHPLWDLNRPGPPNVVYLGGMHQKPEKDLPQELRSYLDSSKNGVIYMSFGTNVVPSLLPKEKVRIFAEVFSRLPYDIIWKWDKDEIPEWTQKIKISKWLPQSDLLRHPNVKLFITQGGLQSTDEAITAGVPMIGVPLHGDQWFNTEQYVKFKIGVQLDLQTLTADTLKNAITTVIDNNQYRENIIALRSFINDQPQTPLERAVWWTEHLLRHGKNIKFRAYAADVTWAEYYELKLVLSVLFVFALSSLLLVKTISIILLKIKLYISTKSKLS